MLIFLCNLGVFAFKSCFEVRTITALAVAALAEAAHPYGIEAFDTVLKPLWMGITKAKGGTKTKAAFLKAIGYIIPLMDAEYAGYYTREVMPEVLVCFTFLVRELSALSLLQNLIHQMKR